MKTGDEIVPGVSREMVNSILGEFRDFMNLYDRAKFDTTTLYEEVILALGSDGDFLAEQLKRAVAFRDLEKEGKLERTLWTRGRYQDG